VLVHILRRAPAGAASSHQRRGQLDLEAHCGSLEHPQQAFQREAISVSPEVKVSPSHEPPRAIVVTPTKSVGIQILLVIFFGPLALFYSTIVGALVMLFGVPVLFGILVTLTSLGAAANGANTGMLIALGSEFVLMLFAWWAGSFVWGILAVNAYNRKLLQGA
jgi:hypothetical protein